MKNFRALFLSAGLALVTCMVSAPYALAVPTTVTAVRPTSVNKGTIAANASEVALTTADVSNGNDYVMEGGETILVTNSDSTARNFTLTSAPDSLGRTLNHVIQLAQNEYALIGPLTIEGWRQSTGKLLLSGDNAGIKFMIMRKSPK